MGSEEITIRLSADQALVLSDWLHRMEQSGQLGAMVKERAVLSALWRIEGTLEATLIEVFRPDYTQQVADAAARLELTLGDFGIAPDVRPSASSRAEPSEDLR